MRLATYEYEGTQAAGVVVGELVHALPGDRTVLDLIRAGLPAALEEGERAVAAGGGTPLADVRLLAPLDPPTVRDFMAFEEHLEGVRMGYGATEVDPGWFEAPTFYFTNPYAVIGPFDDVAVPPGSRRFDFELEVAVIVGRAGSSLSPEEASDHIFGYTILNDWSARDLQWHEMRQTLGPAKGKDSATTLGPWIVTADELEPHRDADGFLDLAMVAELNGKEVGRDLLSNMAWRFEDLIAYASRGTWVRPGDVLGSGTCGNGGCLAELWGRLGADAPGSLQPGDVVTLTVEGIGQIRNTVVAGTDAPVVPRGQVRPRSRPGPDRP